MVEMGFLQLLSKPREKKSLGICVPEAYKRRKHAIMVETPVVSNDNGFLVEGVFAVQDSLMLQGRMVQGSVKVGKEIMMQGKKLKVIDLSVDKRPTQRIDDGQKGALFLQAKSFPTVRAGDLIEF